MDSSEPRLKPATLDPHSFHATKKSLTMLLLLMSEKGFNRLSRAMSAALTGSAAFAVARAAVKPAAAAAAAAAAALPGEGPCPPPPRSPPPPELVWPPPRWLFAAAPVLAEPLPRPPPRPAPPCPCGGAGGLLPGLARAVRGLLPPAAVEAVGGPLLLLLLLLAAAAAPPCCRPTLISCCTASCRLGYKGCSVIAQHGRPAGREERKRARGEGVSEVAMTRSGGVGEGGSLGEGARVCASLTPFGMHRSIASGYVLSTFTSEYKTADPLA